MKQKAEVFSPNGPQEGASQFVSYQRSAVSYQQKQGLIKSGR
jgi:hypothetical protein